MAKPATNNQERFVDAALAVIAEVGVEKLSMRKVASHLGVSAMAMYKHFESRDELLSAALDEFIARAEVLPKKPLSWDAWISYVATGMYNALCQEVSWIPVLGTMQLGPKAISVTDAFVQRLMEEGFSAEDALQAYFAVIQSAIGAACLQVSFRSGNSTQIAPLTQRYLESNEISRLKIAPVLDQATKQDQLALGLPLIIEALRNRLPDQ